MEFFYKKTSNKTIKNILNFYNDSNSNLNNDSNSNLNNVINANYGNSHNYDDNNDFLNVAEDKIKKFTYHDTVHLVNSGNSAILIAMSYFDGLILIPDQGAWHGFKQIAKFLNKEIITVKTNLGLIDLDELNNLLSSNDFKVKNNGKKSSLFLTSFAGYTAEQNIKEIANICHEHGVFLVEDASGAIGDGSGKLANGSYSDIIVASTGSPKMVNFGYGGFISFNIENLKDINNIINLNVLYKSFKVTNLIALGISSELDLAKDNFNCAVKSSKYLKNNLENVFHRYHRGVNVILDYNDNLEYKNDYFQLKNKLKTVEGKSFITKCPNYNRIKEKGIAIELKNLDIFSLNKNSLDYILGIINDLK
ncbi:MAG: DegT/DnrJ/EryC1/StrS family aminotransferase [Methanobrevibacter sp.]|jgi:hypothetical protein|nr:DegT/DnrJ/EryC1/StrS family aminotransferase [Candidatus Methanoflexus mossambicus]